MQVKNLKFQLKTLGVSLGVVFMSSCGSFQNVSTPNDGIYGESNYSNNESRVGIANQRTAEPSINTNVNPKSNASSNTDYANYFKEQGEQIEKARQTTSPESFTDVDNYSSSTNSLPENTNFYYNDDVDYVEYASQSQGMSNGGWGTTASNVNVNIYGGAGWGGGFYDPFFNNWGGFYGPRWGWGGIYGSRWGLGWGGFYGPAWGWGGLYGPAWYGGFYGPGWGYGGGFYGSYAYNRSYRNAGFRNNRNAYANNSGVRSNRNSSSVRGSNNVRSNRNVRSSDRRSSGVRSSANVRGNSSSRNVRSTRANVRSSRSSLSRSNATNVRRVRNSNGVNARSNARAYSNSRSSSLQRTNGALRSTNGTSRVNRSSSRNSNARSSSTRSSSRSTSTRSSSSSRSSGGTRSSGGSSRSGGRR
ncbi:hypothetical protein [Psychroflexus salis]|uniref:Vitellogenin II n=1 Tax=Psychroflexus salis TaxID=1526574 RepID=A0A917E917_9FLAO|nr:hypothetical protein [Psychroflexus salis]GGE12635.1 hypothetical protein GCM10010831_12560 [Psychroflexus salis]